MKHNYQVRALTKETDGSTFIQGNDFQFDAGTWTSTRSAQGNWFLRKTAAANAPNLSLLLNAYFLNKFGNDPLRATGGEKLHDIRGVQIVAFDVVYAIGTSPLNSHAAALNHTLYANNVAPAVATAVTLTGTLATATQAQPYVTTLTTPVAAQPVVGLNVADEALWFELQVNAAVGTVYDLYGVYVKFNYNYL